MSEKAMLLYALSKTKDNEVKGRTRLQKLVFLMQKAGRIPFDFDFVPYFYGPYSRQLERTVQILRNVELLVENPVYMGPTIQRYDITLTPKGRKYLSQAMILGKTQEAIDAFLKEVEVLSTDTLISWSKLIMESTNRSVKPSAKSG